MTFLLTRQDKTQRTVLYDGDMYTLFSSPKPPSPLPQGTFRNLRFEAQDLRLAPTLSVC